MTSLSKLQPVFLDRLLPYNFIFNLSFLLFSSSWLILSITLYVEEYVLTTDFVHTIQNVLKNTKQIVFVLLVMVVAVIVRYRESVLRHGKTLQQQPWKYFKSNVRDAKRTTTRKKGFSTHQQTGVFQYCLN